MTLASPGQAAAFYDVDGTLARTDIVRYYLALRTWGWGPALRALYTLAYLPQVLRWLALDRIDRQRMNEAFYRGYRGLDAERVRRAAAEGYQQILGRHVFFGTQARMRSHRERGERIVLVTGSLDFIVAPLARELGVDDVIAMKLEEREGRFTGRLDRPPLGGPEKAKAIEAFAAAHGIDLALSSGFGDSIWDLPFLEAVGHPVAVNPRGAFLAAARARRWPVVTWAATRSRRDQGVT